MPWIGRRVSHYLVVGGGTGETIRVEESRARGALSRTFLADCAIKEVVGCEVRAGVHAGGGVQVHREVTGTAGLTGRIARCSALVASSVTR